MSLPAGFVEDLRSRVSLSKVVGRKVVWDRKKSNQGKGDLWAPCPFHQERSASFHVDDRKGFYYCFGCHAKGDAVSFLRETENLSFLEAVEWLAREAGMPMPARDPEAARKADRRTELAAVMDEAVKYFRLQLKTAAAAQARDYLAKRKLSPEAQDRFDLGFAPDVRQGLFQALTGKGIPPEMILAAGLATRPDDGGAPYDTFRGRIIFPIRDVRGRAISFGGRALDPNARAKYLNGPATDLFDKGRNLYNIGPAREAAGKGAPLIVAEGYMDTIALFEAGFRATVAPLGTAITEDQLQLMWRIHPEPVIALDGDKAGLAAALRLIDLALPLLEAGKGLRFALLPAGLDPDDLIRSQGALAMQKVIDGAQPMVNLLWSRETEGRNFDSPERKAGLDKTLREALARIRDATLRDRYSEEIRRLTQGLFGAGFVKRPFVPGGKFRKPEPLPPLAATRNSVLAAAGPAPVDEQVLEAVLLATLVIHPDLIPRFESALETLDLATPDHASLREALLRHAHTPSDGFRDRIAADAGPALETLFARSHVQSAPPVRPDAAPDLALMCVAEALAKLDARRGARREIEDAMEDLSGLVDEGLTWRLTKAAEALQGSERSGLETSDPIGEDRAALSRQLQELYDAEVWVKKKR